MSTQQLRLLIVWSVLTLLNGSGTLAGQTEPADSKQYATIPGEVTTPYPTIRNLAVEWKIKGDDNLNGVVTVKYRRVGESDWHEAMPLRRVPAATWKERRTRRTTASRSWGNKHSGSILDLHPDTEYEIALYLHDPDGGSAEHTVYARTRPVPRAMPGAKIKRVHPGDFQEVASNAEPGDLILLGPGNYGFFAPTRDGLPGKPIVFRSDPDGRFEFQKTHRGDALFEGISLQGRKHVYLEELVSNGTIDLFNAEACVVRRCRVHAVYGIISSWTGQRWAPSVAARLKDPPILKGMPLPSAKNCYIADNVIVGMTQWVKEAMGPAGKNMGEGIQITGPGNVICHNRVVGFRDCISTLEDRHVVEQVCIDIYNNDIYVGLDDGIEADFCMGNCRIMRNRMTNCFIGLSSQPGLGGPTYFIRNIMYNIIVFPYKLYRNSVGDVVLHNTVVKTGAGPSCPAAFSRAYFRNNLGIGGGGLGVSGSRRRNVSRLAANFPAADSTCDFDYNGYGTVGMPFQGNIAGHKFDGLESLRANTSEKRGVEVDLDIFASEVVIPHPSLTEWNPPDLRLRPGAAAVDAGMVIPNVNDRFTGRAPDLGAYELGQEAPIYGPRPF